MVFSFFQPNVKKLAENQDIMALIDVLKRGSLNIKTLRQAMIALAQIGRPILFPLCQAIEKCGNDPRIKTNQDMIGFQVNAAFTLAFMIFSLGDNFAKDLLLLMDNESINYIFKDVIATAICMTGVEKWYQEIQINRKIDKHQIDTFVKYNNWKERWILILLFFKDAKGTIQTKFLQRVEDWANDHK